jgi:hypothetical protein
MIFLSVVIHGAKFISVFPSYIITHAEGSLYIGYYINAHSMITEELLSAHQTFGQVYIIIKKVSEV